MWAGAVSICSLLFGAGCLPQGKVEEGTAGPGGPIQSGSAPDGGPSGPDGGSGTPDGGPLLTTSTCTSPIQQLDVSHPTTVVGDGTRSSCTEDALERAVQRGGTITFNCGGSATIPVTRQKVLRTDVDTTIDGQGQVTLDGMGSARLFYFGGPDFRRTTTLVTLQNLVLINGKSTGTSIPEIPGQPPQCSRGFQVDGSGAAIFIHDGVLHAYNVTFQNNRAAALGPDVGGGAIYALGSKEVVVVSSRFIGNSASNGGAIAALNTDVTVVNSGFTQSSALGNGGNDYDPACPFGESGSGGSGGAIYMDGGADGTATFCGNVFANSRGGDNAFGGAIFRTPDDAMQVTIIDQCIFDHNSAPGGGALYVHNSQLRITKSTFSDNHAVIGGTLQADGTILTAENSTFSNNQTTGPWGVIALFAGQGDLRSCTFVGNRADFSPVAPDFAGVTIENSVFLGNLATGGNISCDLTNSGSGNLQWPDPGGNQPNALSGCVRGVGIGDPQLSNLEDHGGPTPTFLPAPSSSAARRASACPATDQRNLPRPNQNACTAGSVEIR